jgi:hypothetical protein
MRLHAVLERFRVRRRPPASPLTTTEQSAAEKLRQETLVKHSERSEGNQGERS